MNKDIIIDEDRIFKALGSRIVDRIMVEETIAKAKELKGLDSEDISALMNLSDPELLSLLFSTAKQVKESIYGKRLVLFAPLYISNLCNNECLYCAFRARNKALKRRALTQEEISQETKILVEQGHKRVLLVAGEAYPDEGFEYILKAIDTIYQTKSINGEIRRINANIAPLEVEEFKRLKGAKIGTYQLFQETYHRETYNRVHTGGKKRDYNWRLTAIDRSMQAGIDDVGIGILFGLYDWRFEILALMQHIHHLEECFGTGPHTISVPRLEPASNSNLASQPPYPVSDIDFRKIVAILRLAVPYTGIIMSTRETPLIRRETFALGVSQISAGSRTSPGGYSKDDTDEPVLSTQFSLGDHRSLNEVIEDVAALGYIPSFCTACYRLKRTGVEFMHLAKPGEIKNFCDPNAVSTFAEYLLDYGSEECKNTGFEAIERAVATMDKKTAMTSKSLLDKLMSGKRDVFC